MASAPATALETTSGEESWIMVDDWAPGKHEVDESVLNPMSSRERSMNSLRNRLRKLKPKLSTPSTEKRAEQCCQEERSNISKIFGRLRPRSFLKEKQNSQDER